MSPSLAEDVTGGKPGGNPPAAAAAARAANAAGSAGRAGLASAPLVPVPLLLLLLLLSLGDILPSPPPVSISCLMRKIPESSLLVGLF